MSTTTQVPVEIDAEAADRVAELGMQNELDQMIEYIRRTVTGLHSIEITPYPDYEVGGPPEVLLAGWLDGTSPSSPDDGPEMAWTGWFYDTFPPSVMRWFRVGLHRRGDYGR